MVRSGDDPADVARAVAAAGLIITENLSDPDLRSDAAAQAASIVSAIPEVRSVLRDVQQNFAHQDGGAVLDGRDIGTVIAPDADAKFFVTASVDVRAHRRWSELHAEDNSISLDDVLDDMRRRDARDTSRTVSPLQAADDAAILDTDKMDADQVFAQALKHIEKSVKQ
jgi:cytidylate kinase